MGVRWSLGGPEVVEHGLDLGLGHRAGTGDEVHDCHDVILLWGWGLVAQLEGCTLDPQQRQVGSRHEEIVEAAQHEGEPSGGQALEPLVGADSNTLHSDTHSTPHGVPGPTGSVIVIGCMVNTVETRWTARATSTRWFTERILCLGRHRRVLAVWSARQVTTTGQRRSVSTTDINTEQPLQPTPAAYDPQHRRYLPRSATPYSGRDAQRFLPLPHHRSQQCTALGEEQPTRTGGGLLAEIIRRSHLAEPWAWVQTKSMSDWADCFGVSLRSLHRHLTMLHEAGVMTSEVRSVASLKKPGEYPIYRVTFACVVDILMLTTSWRRKSSAVRVPNWHSQSARMARLQLVATA